ILCADTTPKSAQTAVMFDSCCNQFDSLTMVSRVENRRSGFSLLWLLGRFRVTRLNPVWPNSVSCSPGRAVARPGLRMMPASPPLPLKFRRADFLRYGFKAGISDGAFPSTTRSSRRAVCLHPSCSSPGTYCSRSEEHTSELQSRFDLVCRLLLEKKK